MKASIVEMEGLLGGKCVPAKMLVNESLAEYLVRQFDGMYERLEAAYSLNKHLELAVRKAEVVSEALRRKVEAEERERDELRTLAEEQSKLAGINAARAQKAEAEIARRDAAAGEPVAVLYRNGDVLTKAECGKYFEICCKVETPLYTAAPPAVLPPDITFESKGFRSLTSEDMAYNLALMKARELGAQQQEVVELDNVFSVNVAGVAVRVVLLKDVSTSLDAAGVKWEVKK